MKQKQSTILTAALLCVLSILLLLISVSGEGDHPTMFCNDDPFVEEKRLGFERIFSQYYLPVSMFTAIDGVEVKENKRLNTLLISYGNHYISFDVDSNFAYTEQDGNFFLRTYLLKGGERYVQGESVCRALGLTFEVSEIYGVVRVKDNTAKKTIDQLIASHQTQTVPPEQTEPTRPNVNFPAETKNVYLFFDGLPENPNEILALLAQYGAKATFFLDGTDLTIGGRILTEMMVGGHAIGLSTPNGLPQTNGSTLVASLHELNEALFRVTKTKTRLFHMPYGTNGRESVGEDIQRALISDGFKLFRSTIDVGDEYQHYTSSQITVRVLNDMLNADSLVLRFGNGKETKSILEGILRYLSENGTAYRCLAFDDTSYVPF